MRISDWSSDVCSSDLNRFELTFDNPESEGILDGGHNMLAIGVHMLAAVADERELGRISLWEEMKDLWDTYRKELDSVKRSEEHTSELQSLMRISYAVFCLKKKKNNLKKPTKHKQEI